MLELAFLGRHEEVLNVTEETKSDDIHLGVLKNTNVAGKISVELMKKERKLLGI